MGESKRCPVCKRIDCTGECPFDSEEGRSESYYDEENSGAWL